LSHYYWLRPPRNGTKHTDNNKKALTSSKSQFISSVLVPLTKKASSSSLFSNFTNKGSGFSESNSEIGGGVCSNNVSTGIKGSDSDDRNWFQLESLACNATINYSGAKR